MKTSNSFSETERTTFIEQNIGLVRLIAKRFLGRGIEYDDLYQAGCMGLCKATDRFDPERGLAFSTYAVPVILGEMKRLFREGGSVKVSRNLKEAGLRLKKVSAQLETALGRSPTIKELAEAAEYTEDFTAEALMASGLPLSLSDSEDENGRPTELPEESRENEITERLSLQRELFKLPPVDRELICLRYFQGMTQSAVAEKLCMTQVQVSRREKKLLSILRTALSG